METGVLLLEVADLDLEVSLRCLKRLVSKELRDVGYVDTVCDESRRARVPEAVAGDPLLTVEIPIDPIKNRPCRFPLLRRSDACCRRAFSEKRRAGEEGAA